MQPGRDLPSLHELLVLLQRRFLQRLQVTKKWLLSKGLLAIALPEQSSDRAH